MATQISEIIKKVPTSFWREWYSYNPETGTFTRKEVPEKYFRSRAAQLQGNQFAGKEYNFTYIPRTSNSHTLIFRFQGEKFKMAASKMAWFYNYRTWPTEYVHCYKEGINCYRQENLKHGGARPKYAGAQPRKPRILPIKKPVANIDKPENPTPAQLHVYNEMVKLTAEENAGMRKKNSKEILTTQIVHDKCRKEWKLIMRRGTRSTTVGKYPSEKLAIQFGEQLSDRYKDHILIR